MANSQGDYKNLITELIQKQMDIFGANIALDIAQKTPGLGVSVAGVVENLSGDGALILQDLVDSYALLSEPITQVVLAKILEKYPALKKQYHEPITHVDLACSLFEKTNTQSQ